MNFPLITWSDLVGPVTVNGSIPSGPPGTAQQRYGFGINNTTTKEGASDSVADYLADAVNAGLGLSAVTQARYVYTDGPGPSNSPLGIRWNNVTASAITIGFGTVAMANKFGFATTTVTIPAAPPIGVGYLDTTINPGMFWGPGGLAGDVRRMLTQRAASSSSDMSGLTTDVVNWGAVADLEMLSTIFPAANYTRWWQPSKSTPTQPTVW